MGSGSGSGIDLTPNELNILVNKISSHLDSGKAIKREKKFIHLLNKAATELSEDSDINDIKNVASQITGYIHINKRKKIDQLLKKIIVLLNSWGCIETRKTRKIEKKRKEDARLQLRENRKAIRNAKKNAAKKKIADRKKEKTKKRLNKKNRSRKILSNNRKRANSF